MKTSKIYFVALDTNCFSINDAELLNETVFVGYQALAAYMNEMGSTDYWEIYDPDNLACELNDGMSNLQANNWFAVVTVIDEEDEI